MDMTASIEARSDQINADDLIPGPRTYTIEKVTKGAADQPFDFHLTESPGRVYRPNKSMRRVIVDAWSPDTSTYAGHRLTLYRDPDVKWAGEAVGGIKISHLSHIDKPRSLSLTVTRSHRKPHIVQPLIESAPMTPIVPATAEQIAASAAHIAECDDPAVLRGWWKGSDAERRALIEARVAEIGATNTPAIEATVDTATGEILDAADTSQWDEAGE